MNKIVKNFKNDDGTEETMEISSMDNLNVSLKGNYRLANMTKKKESKLAQRFKGSILGSDIGFKSQGFSSVAILATVIAISVVAILYFMWRF